MENPLGHIIRTESNTTFMISTPRVGHYKPESCAKFLATYKKQENVKPQSERISKENGIVKVWLRGYGGYSYMLETTEENLVED